MLSDQPNHSRRNSQTSTSSCEVVALAVTIADQKPPRGKNMVRLKLDRAPMRNVAKAQICRRANPVLPNEDAGGTLAKGVR